jgi:hypothetical protein
MNTNAFGGAVIDRRENRNGAFAGRERGGGIASSCWSTRI